MPEILQKIQILEKTVRGGLCFVKASHCSEETEDCTGQFQKKATQEI